MIRRVIAVAAIAGAMVVAPLAASASTYGSLAGPNTAPAGAPISFLIDPFTATYGEVTVTGPSTVSILSAATTTDIVYPSGGVLSFEVDAPTPGDYTISVTTSEDEFVGSETITVVAATEDELGETGFDGAALIWFGGGALALGVALVVTMSIVRRNARQTTPV